MLGFRIANQWFGVALSLVECVVGAVALTELPGAPRSIRGILNLHGTLIPVGDLRRRLALPDREIDPGDCIVLARTPRRMIGLLTEGDVEILERGDEGVVPVESLVRADDSIRGVLRLESGLLFIHDVARFLSLDEERELDRALENA